MSPRNDDKRIDGEEERLRELQRDLAELRRAEPPPGLGDAVMRRVRNEKPSHPLFVFFFRPRVFLLRTSVASALTAAAVVALVAAAGLYLLRTPETAGPGESRTPPPPVMAQDDGTAPPVAKDIAEEPAADATRPVVFSIRLPSAKDVRLVGDFNEWSEDGIRLEGRGGLWTVELKLRPGKVQYMFLVDEKDWVADENADAVVDDGFGTVNSIRYVM